MNGLSSTGFLEMSPTGPGFVPVVYGVFVRCNSSSGGLLATERLLDQSGGSAHSGGQVSQMQDTEVIHLDLW